MAILRGDEIEPMEAPTARSAASQVADNIEQGEPGAEDREAENRHSEK